MKFVASLLLLALVGSAYADFADLTGKIKPLNLTSGTKIRKYDVTLIPDVEPRVVVLKGVAVDFVDRKHFDVDAVIFALNTFARTTLQFGYFHAARDANAGNSNSPTSDFDLSAFGFLLRFFFVFEYVDVNGIPGFQFGQDNITGKYDLSSPLLKWNLKAEEVSQVDANGKSFTVRIFTAETADQVFALRFVSSGNPIDVDGQDLGADHCKFDVRIRWFNNSLHVPALWTTGPSNFNTAQVGFAGVYGAAGGSFERQVSVDKSNSTQIAFNAGNFTAFFKWVTEATVTKGGVVSKQTVRDFTVDINSMPVDVEVINNFVAGWVKKIIVHSFDGQRPDEVVLDPVFGPQINYDKIDSGFGVALAPSFSLLLVLSALFFKF